MKLITIFSGTAKATAGSKIAFDLPKKYTRVVGIQIASAGKVEVSLNIGGLQILQRSEFASREKDLIYEGRGPHPLHADLTKTRVQGAVKSLTGTTQTGVKIMLQLE